MEIKTLVVGELNTNCYWVCLPGREDGILIDPGAEPDTIKAAVGEKTVAAILLTHGHFDHIGALGAFPDVPVYLHEKDALMLTDNELNAGSSFGFCLPPLKELPRFVQEGDVLPLAGMEIKAMHLPGHTPGGMGYAVEDVIFTGDTLFQHGYGRTDLPGGSFTDLRASLRRLLFTEEDRRIFPGHGPATSVFGERRRGR